MISDADAEAKEADRYAHLKSAYFSHSRGAAGVVVIKKKLTDLT